MEYFFMIDIVMCRDTYEATRLKLSMTLDTINVYSLIPV